MTTDTAFKIGERARCLHITHCKKITIPVPCPGDEAREKDPFPEAPAEKEVKGDPLLS